MIQLRHRFFLMIVLLLCINQVNANAIDNERFYNFDVYLDDQIIGYHYFELKYQNGQQQLLSKARFNVKFLFVDVYDYYHENSETWKNQCLKNLSSHTNANGEKLFVTLTSEKQQTLIETAQGRQTVDQCIRSFAYWDPQLLTMGQALNTQTGELVDITLTYIGPDKITINNRVIDSEHYRLHGNDLDISLWYSKTRQWLALKSTTDNGQVIHYQLQDGLIQ